MTREQKLALIIGFSLILAVGVLISDHLSRAQSDPIVADQDIDYPMIVHNIIDVPPGMGEIGRPLAGRDAVPMDPGIRGGSLPGIDTALSQRSTHSDMQIPTEVALSAQRDTPVRSGISIPDQTTFTPTQSQLSTVGQDVGEVLDLPGFVPVSGYPQPGISSRRDLGRNQQTRQTPPRQQQAAPARVAVATHTVTEGESLYGLAAKYYGDGNLWPLLAKANASRVNEKGHVLAGVVLEIPDRNGSAQATPAQNRLAQSAPMQTQTPVETGAYGTYTIKSGDTLSEISQELMGTMRRMSELIELNRDQINDADDIREGMKLRYPRGQRA